MNDGNSFGRHHSADRTVLVTDATSVVGDAVLHRLVDEYPAGRLAGATFARSRHWEGLGARIIHGAPDVPHLGLLPRAYEELAREVDAVVYTGPVPIGPRVGPAVGRQIGEVLSFTEHAAAPLYFVGTAFPESNLDPRHPRRPAVEGWEQLVAARGLPLVVLRPSLVIGDSRTGAIAALPALYQVMEAVLNGDIRVIAADPRARLDFVPGDLVADVIVRLIDDDVRVGDYWLTAGELALTIEQAVDVLADYARSEQLEFRPPRFETPASAPGFAPGPGRAHPAGSRRRLLTTLDRGLAHCLARWPLETSLGDRFTTSIGELGGLGVAALPDPRASLAASLKFWGRALEQDRPERALA